ncbi:unnamed protein product [Brassicogethes aeneus]|uniref:Uncharacterized protein n=1 Tax=Brassicogethes aeneus TaxID=1431903 RepID=A0A9P0FDD4_BRAAE|nr:unnamed protein product [Brassicogethes aeneus]
MSDDVIEFSEQYFNIEVIRNVHWVPSIACTSCIVTLRKWAKGEVESMPFGIPMVWTDPGNHEVDQCYVCVNKNSKVEQSRKSSRRERASIGEGGPCEDAFIKLTGTNTWPPF